MISARSFAYSSTTRRASSERDGGFRSCSPSLAEGEAGCFMGMDLQRRVGAWGFAYAATNGKEGRSYDCGKRGPDPAQVRRSCARPRPGVRRLSDIDRSCFQWRRGCAHPRASTALSLRCGPKVWLSTTRVTPGMGEDSDRSSASRTDIPSAPDVPMATNEVAEFATRSGACPPLTTLPSAKTVLN